MSLQTLCIKTEAEDVHVKEEAEEVHVRQGAEEVHVKQGAEEVHVKQGAEEVHVKQGAEEVHVKEEAEKVHVKEEAEEVHVKQEAEEVHVKEEAEEACGNEELGALGKEEAACGDSAGLRDLYACHEIKAELVLGSEETHRPCVPSALPAAAARAEEARGRACSVRLERPLVDAERRSCRAGPRAYTLRRAREPSDGTDTASNIYQCDQCGKGFRHKAALRKHVHTHLLVTPSTHSKKSSETLSKTVTNLKDRVQGHYTSQYIQSDQMVHTGDKPFQCSYCDYKCSYKSILRRHERIHTGEKPYKCSHCDYKCSLESNLQRHKRIH